MPTFTRAGNPQDRKRVLPQRDATSLKDHCATGKADAKGR
jgi:hypothetical protein